MEAVNGLLAKLANDGDLHDDLKQPQVQVAMKHWTGQHRLPPDQAEKLMADYRVMAVLGKIRGLQTACQRAGIPVPLDAVLRRESSLKLPPGEAPATTAAAKPKPKEEEEEEEEEAAAGVKAAATAEGEGKAKPPSSKEEKSKAKQQPAAAAAAVTTPAAAPAVVKAPENWFQWLHLLSPLILMGMGLLYAAYRMARG